MFETNCQICHQAGGVGVAGQFPRLAGRVGAIASSDDGRKLLPTVVLYGMSGSVAVDSQNRARHHARLRDPEGRRAGGSAELCVEPRPAGEGKPRPFTAAQIAGGADRAPPGP